MLSMVVLLYGELPMLTPCNKPISWRRRWRPNSTSLVLASTPRWCYVVAMSIAGVDMDVLSIPLLHVALALLFEEFSLSSPCINPISMEFHGEGVDSLAKVGLHG